MDKIKHILFPFLLCWCVSVLFSSCRYEEGPFINFTRVDNRIRGEWEITKIERNGISVSESNRLEEAMGSVMDFYRTHVFFIHCNYNTIVYNCEGSWDFGEKKRSIIVVYKGLRHIVSQEYQIVKFKNNELKLRYTDNDGIVWTITLELLLSYIEYGY